MRQKIQREPDAAQWRIASAGTWTNDRLLASENSRLAMLARKLDISKHRSKCITAKIMQEYDLILTMERGHKEALHAEFPEQARNTFMLSEMVGGRFDIEDPYGSTLDDYQKTADDLDRLLDEGYEYIVRLARQF
jgi:protein-tyrosine-phosphatase